jgi:hypothetical protein
VRQAVADVAHLDQVGAHVAVDWDALTAWTAGHEDDGNDVETAKEGLRPWDT